MIVLFGLFVIIAFASSLPAWKWASGRVRWYRWDYGVPAYGILTWIVLELIREYFDVGHQASLSNFVVETFWVFVATVISPWVRVLFPGKNDKTQLASSVCALFIPIIVAIALRSFMPTLPE